MTIRVQIGSNSPPQAVDPAHTPDIPGRRRRPPLPTSDIFARPAARGRPPPWPSPPSAGPDATPGATAGRSEVALSAGRGRPPTATASSSPSAARRRRPPTRGPDVRYLVGDCAAAVDAGSTPQWSRRQRPTSAPPSSPPAHSGAAPAATSSPRRPLSAAASSTA